VGAPGPYEAGDHGFALFLSAVGGRGHSGTYQEKDFGERPNNFEEYFDHNRDRLGFRHFLFHIQVTKKINRATERKRR
jgi:hypothetical protein